MKEKRLQVFVSSTFTDLQEERQAAVSAILKAGHIPAGMELFTAGDKSQWATIREWIDMSDVYMLILGGRYGSIDPLSGKSYTELEYDYAVEKSKPLFAVVIEDSALDAKVQSAGKSVLELDNPKQLAAFRTKVLSNISSFFSDERDVKLCVFETLPRFASNPDLVGWIPGNLASDPGPLLDQIKRLTTENDDLRAKLNAATAKEANGEQGMMDLVKILKNKKISVPGKALNRDHPWDTDVFTFIFANRNAVISGATNAANVGAVGEFIYFHVCSVLFTHGLMQNKPVAGGKYRMYELTPLGARFFAFLDKQELKITEKQPDAVLAVEVNEESVEAPSTKKAPTKTRRKKEPS